MLKIMVFSLLGGGTALLGISIKKQTIGQQHQLEQQEEEEILTQYESKENLLPPEEKQVSNLPLQNGLSTTEPSKDWRKLGWEFKIVRAKRDLFQNPAIFNRVCAEEAEAGWILLEKLDERRLRFKRPMALRELIKPETLNHDPYRCYYRSPFSLTTWLGMIALLTAIILPGFLGYTFVSRTLNRGHFKATPSPSPTGNFRF